MPKKYRYIVRIDGTAVDIQSDTPLSYEERLTRARQILAQQRANPTPSRTTAPPRSAAQPPQRPEIPPLENETTRRYGAFLASIAPTAFHGARTWREIEQRIVDYMPGDLRTWYDQQDPRTQKAFIRGVIRGIEEEHARRAGGLGSAIWDAFVRPETLRPDYERRPQITRVNAFAPIGTEGNAGVRSVGILEGTGNLLSTPLRALTTTLLTRYGQGRTFGRESGQPTLITDWASVYAADPNWGSVLEALAPNANPLARQIAGIVLNITADPLNLAGGLGIIGRGARTFAPTQRALQTARRAEQAGRRLQRAGQAMQRSANPATRAIGRAAQTVGRTTERTAQAAQTPLPALSTLDVDASRNLSAALGIDPIEATRSASPLRIVGLPLHALLDPIGVTRAVQHALQHAPAGQRLNQIYETLANMQALRSRAARGEDVLQLLREYRTRGRLYAPEIDELRYLTPEELQEARRLAVQYAPELDTLTEQYLRTARETPNAPLVIDPDRAKDLIPEYAASVRHRAKYSPIVHPISNAIANNAYLRALQNPEVQEVVLLMGAPGAGKSTLLEEMTRTGQLGRNALVYDSAFRSLGAVQWALDAARQAGKPVRIVYLHAEPALAVDRVIRRAYEHGRAPALEFVINAQQGALQTIQRLLRQTPEGVTRIDLYQARPDGVRPLSRRELLSISPLSENARDRVLYIARQRLHDYHTGSNQHGARTLRLGETLDPETRNAIYQRLHASTAPHGADSAGTTPVARRATGQTRGDRDPVGTQTRRVSADSRGVPQALSAEAARIVHERQREPSPLERALYVWKASKTSLNLPSYPRNFVQNLLLWHLQGEPTHRLPAAALRLLRNPERFRQLWNATASSTRETTNEARHAPTALQTLLQQAARAFEGVDRLSATLLAEAASKNPQRYLFYYGEIPRTLQYLRRSGVMPFVAWSYFAVPGVLRGAINHPARTRQILAAISALQPNPEKRGEYVQLGDRELRTGTILPLNPTDFGPEMQLVDPRQAPLFQLFQGLGMTLAGEGRPSPAQDLSTYNRLVDTALFLKDFALPPWLTYALPGLIAPPQPQPGKRRPRTRADYARALLGFGTRPVDPHADARAYWNQLERELQHTQQRLQAGGE